MEASNPEVTTFLADAIGPFMGALFGFLFGFLLQEITEIRKGKKRKAASRARKLFLLRSTYASVFWNMEAVAFVKKNLCVPLKADSTIVENAYGNSQLPQLANVLVQCQHFFRGFEEVQYDLSDELSRIGFVERKDNYFSKTEFHINIALKSMYDFIVQRNEMLSRYADATRDGMNAAHANYFIPMLLSQADGIIAKTDDSLFFMVCMAKQLEKHADETFSSEPFPEGLFVLQELVNQIPDGDYIAGYVDAIGINYDKPRAQENN